MPHPVRYLVSMPGGDNNKIYDKAQIDQVSNRECSWPQITQLKIASNPFAKGFRDCDPDDW